MCKNEITSALESSMIKDRPQRHRCSIQIRITLIQITHVNKQNFNEFCDNVYSIARRYSSKLAALLNLLAKNFGKTSKEVELCVILAKQ